MKVLQVNKFNYLRGGADKYFLDLSEMLEKHGVEVAKFCMRDSNNLLSKFEDYFVSKIDFNSFRFKYLFRIIYNFKAAKKFKRLLEDFKPDIIHIHNIYHQISPSILPVAKKKNIPVVMHVHDYKLVCPNYKMFARDKICEQCKGGKYYKCLRTKCFKNSLFKSLLASIEMYLHHKVWNIYHKNINLYIAPTEFVKNKLIEWGVDENKIKILHHYIDVNEFKPDYEPGDYFVYFGRLSKEKGVDKLVQVMPEIKDIKLKIIGSGPEHKAIQNKIDALNLKGKVEIMGPKHNNELKEIIRKSYAVIAPSQWYEVFGLVNLEAAALGKLVIASKIGGIPEVVKDKQTGLLFQHDSSEDLIEKINWALNNPEKVKKMGYQAREFVEQKFKPARHLQDILGVYYKFIQ
ncbi:MAG: glycosyltransferase family 4 protein [bacterium]